jgi:hypothetical protein
MPTIKWIKYYTSHPNLSGYTFGLKKYVVNQDVKNVEDLLLQSDQPKLI